ncbi:uncharacterized protein LOC130899396 [Diorhabda carinulata]|uniref:uncharacterized protein LOC130899396 n=1 Tax=Diorhabda carinulata TaxID=1163345 RepID=UPI0025A01765|nr:uncharacterized protein LOC130899396 [Diorhabda carinulata]
MNKLRLYILVLCSVIVQVTANCETPLEIRGVEDYCWSTKVEMREKIHEIEVKAANFARKKLGMDVNEPKVPQKCDYYYCVFQELKLLNPQYDVPCIDRTSTWVKKNVVYNEALELLERIKMCTGELANVTMSGNGFYFYADNVDKPQADKILENTGEEQSKCDISKEYMKCLAAAEKDHDCPIFIYP